MARGVKYDYIDEKSKPFVNPYNFVPVDFQKEGERVDVTQKRDALLTGYLDCKLRCRTPLAIPDTQNRKDNPAVKKGHYKYPFYMAGGTVPVIPGSAIRGVIRNVYETLTDSCYGTMQKNTMITIRSGKPFAPGLLIKDDNGWNLYSAKRWLLVTDRRFYDEKGLDREGIECYDLEKHPLKALRTGESVLFHPARNAKGEITYSKTNGKANRVTLIGPYIKKIEEEGADGAITGYFCRGEIAPRRHFQSVFVKCELVRREIGEIDFARLESILDIYRDKSINRKYKDGSERPHNGYPEYETAKRRGIIPVYYDNTARPETRNGKLYMSFAALGRKAFQRTMNENVQLRAHQGCIQRRSLCPACALFGTAEGEKLGSRVRFSDALCTNYSEDTIKKNVVFEELSSPRISFLPFYMKETGKNKKNEKEKEVDYRAGYDSDDLEIRGRKYYWHHVPAAPGKIELTERNATYDVLQEGAEFSFHIYFDRITPGQLAMLEEAVHLNENMLDGDLCHKIGHGKPLGYGSVKIAIENCVLRSFDVEHGWSETTAEIPCPQNAHTCDDLTYRSLMMICNFRAIENFGDAKVEYPSIISEEGCPVLRGRADNNLAAHKWFSENFKLNQPTAVSLPEILEEKGQLCKKKAVKPGGESIRTGSSRSAEKPVNMSEKIYVAKILSSGRPARNLNYTEYNIEIEEDAYLSGRKCTMTARKSIQLSMGQKVKVIQYRGALFNFKGW